MTAACGARVAAKMLDVDRAHRKLFDAAAPGLVAPVEKAAEPQPRLVLLLGHDAETLTGALHEAGILTGPNSRELRAVGLGPARGSFESALAVWLKEQIVWSTIWLDSGEQSPARGGSRPFPGVVPNMLEDRPRAPLPHVSVIGPADSRSWQHVSLAQLRRRLLMVTVTPPACVGGAPYRRGITINTTLPQLCLLAQPCHCRAHHVRLRGSVLLADPDGTRERRTKSVNLAAKLPPALCRVFAS